MGSVVMFYPCCLRHSPLDESSLMGKARNHRMPVAESSRSTEKRDHPRDDIPAVRLVACARSTCGHSTGLLKDLAQPLNVVKELWAHILGYTRDQRMRDEICLWFCGS